MAESHLLQEKVNLIPSIILVYRALSESIISISKAASLLNENREVIKNNLLSPSPTSSISFLAR